jgi:hypothetical protein
LEGRYTSHYIPQLAEKILEENRDDRINLNGIMISNAAINCSDYRGLAGYAWNHAAVSNKVYSFSNDGVETDQCDSAWNNFFDVMKDIDLYGLYTPACTTNDDDQRRRRRLALSMTNKQAVPPILQLLRPLLQQLRDRVPELRRCAGGAARQRECHHPLQVVALQQRRHEALKPSLLAIVLVPIKSHINMKRDRFIRLGS